LSQHAILSVGGSVGFFNGNIKLLQDDIVTLKPTLFVGVPRVYQVHAHLLSPEPHPSPNSILTLSRRWRATCDQRFYDAAMAKIAAFSGAPLPLDPERTSWEKALSALVVPLLTQRYGGPLTACSLPAGPLLTQRPEWIEPRLSQASRSR
jgi:hypothetical protein